MIDSSSTSDKLLQANLRYWTQYTLTFFSWFTPKRLLYLFLFCQPLMEYSLHNEFNIIRHIVWRVIIVFLFSFTLYDAVFTRNSISLPNFIRAPLFVYIITALLSTILAYLLTSIDSLRGIYAISTFALLLLFIKVIPYWFNSKISILRVINVYVLATVITNIYGVIEFVINRMILNDIFFRMSSVFKDPNIYARFNLIAIFFLLSILFFNKNLTRNLKIYNLFALLLSGLSIFMSLSRSGYLTLLLGLVIFSFLFKGKKYKLIAIAVVLLIASFGILLLATQRDFLGGTAIIEASGINRIQLILGGIEIIKENWLLGIGYTNFGNYYVTNYVSQVLRITEFNYYMMGYATSIHNWLIEIWAEQGIIGLAAFVFLFGNLLKYLFSNFKKAIDSITKVCLSSFFLMTLVFLIHGFFYHTFIFHFFFWLMFGFTVSLIIILEKDRLLN